MDDEMVDIVNKENEPVYNTSKSNAHKKGLLHRTVIAEIIDKKGNWLLVKQSSSRQDAGRYVSPVGGHVKAGESCDNAIKREAKEEIGLANIDFKYIGKLIFNRNVLGRHENHYFIVYEIYSDERPMLNYESVSWKKFSLKELKYALRTTPEIFGDAFFPVLNTLYPNIKPT